MTTYSAISDSEIAVGAPLTNNLATKLRNNPLAIAEGDASAPEIDGSALTASSVPDSAMVNDPTAGRWSLVTSGSVSAANNISITGIATGYRELLFIVAEIYSNDNFGIYNIRMGDGSYSSVYAQLSTLYTDIRGLSGSELSTTDDSASAPYSMTCHVKGNGLTMWKNVTYSAVIQNSTTPLNNTWEGYVGVTTEIDQIQLRITSGTLAASGNYYLYGLV